MYESLKKEVPSEIRLILQIPGIDPKKMRQLQSRLNIRNLADLELAAKNNQLVQLLGFSRESEQQILKVISSMRAQKTN